MYCIIVLIVKLISSVLSLIVFNFCDWFLGLPYKCKLFYAFVELIPSSFIGSFSLMLMSYWMRENPLILTCHRCISESFLGERAAFQYNLQSRRGLSECCYKLFEEIPERIFRIITN